MAGLSRLDGGGTAPVQAGTELPILPFLPGIVSALAEAGALVLSAEPGAGKTSLVPLAIAGAPAFSGRILLVEPRRVAAVSAAARLAELDGSALGQRIGYRVRGETRVGGTTRVEVVTGGVFVRMVQSDPSLTGVDVVVFDEFHERSLDIDLGLALALESRELRGGSSAPAGRLSLLAMSATIDVGRLATHLGAATISVPGRAFPVETIHAARSPDDVEARVRDLILDALRDRGGDILAFLPGMAEILRVEAGIRPGAGKVGVEVLRLHGSLPLEEQRRVIVPAPGSPRRVILATSIAETSITVPRVSVVVDSGLARGQRYDQRSGLNRLVTGRESQDRADQRRGRAGRLGPGTCLRAWAESDGLPERSPPEMAVADLSGLVLESLVWGARRRLDLPWLDPPSEASWDAALGILDELGALAGGGGPSPKGRIMATLGTEPRLAALVLEGRDREGTAPGSARAACLAAALVGEGSAGDTNDFAQRVTRLEGAGRGDPGARRVLEEAERLARRADIAGGRRGGGSPSGSGGDGDLSALVGPLCAAAWPERVARREEQTGGSATFALPAGRLLRAALPLSSSPWIVALDADAGETLGRVWAGLALDEEEALAALRPLVKESVELHWKGRSYRARRLRKAGSLILSSTAIGALERGRVAASFAERVGREGFAALLPAPASEAWLARLRFWLGTRAPTGFPGGEGLPSFDPGTLAREAALWMPPFVDPDPAEVLPDRSLLLALEARLPAEARRLFVREAPARLELPSGRSLAVLYDQGPAPLVESRVADFFGLAEHPRIAGLPVVLRLLSPAGRPVQVTADLPGFWKGAWAEARKELRGRYPKHDWPEHPETASPPARRAGRPG